MFKVYSTTKKKNILQYKGVEEEEIGSFPFPLALSPIATVQGVSVCFYLVHRVFVFRQMGQLCGSTKEKEKGGYKKGKKRGCQTHIFAIYTVVVGGGG